MPTSVADADDSSGRSLKEARTGGFATLTGTTVADTPVFAVGERKSDAEPARVLDAEGDDVGVAIGSRCNALPPHTCAGGASGTQVGAASFRSARNLARAHAVADGASGGSVRLMHGA
mmetsp:Transcript_30487/g.94170  ORF Transcript_30487/g.94170 Transcript_30487/m.94170 type:complete len:118 (+) Transcript_30487:147-500(+)